MTTPEELTDEIRRHIDTGEYRAAAGACDRLNAEFPNFDYGWFMTSRVALIIQKPLPALQAIERALEISPERPEWLFQKLRCLGQVGYVAEAREMAAGLAQLQFKDPDTSSELAMLLSRLRMYAAATQQFRRAIELGSDNPDDFLNLAAAERVLGNVNAALDALDECLQRRPDDSGAHYLRSTLRVQTAAENHVAALEAAIERAVGSTDDVIRLHYAAAKELEDLGEYVRSFEHLKIGAALKRSQLNYSNEQELETLQTVRELCTQERFARSPAGYIDAGPIFIIGLPRTGTALVDQILCSHPVVHSAAARQLFPQVLTEECMRSDDTPPASITELITRAVAADFERVGEDYVASARPQSVEPGHFVDCSPMNFLYAGFIHLALPKARIVVLERDAMDACFLAFKTLFEGAFPFSYDLDEIADFYRGYRQQIAHWQAVMPDVMHTVNYEELVTNPRQSIEDLLEHCGLSFDPDCLGFWNEDIQVVHGERQPTRQEVAAASIGIAKHYETELAELRERISA